MQALVLVHSNSLDIYSFPIIVSFDQLIPEIRDLIPLTGYLTSIRDKKGYLPGIIPRKSDIEVPDKVISGHILMDVSDPDRLRHYVYSMVKIFLRDTDYPPAAAIDLEFAFSYIRATTLKGYQNSPHLPPELQEYLKNNIKKKGKNHYYFPTDLPSSNNVENFEAELNKRNLSPGDSIIIGGVLFDTCVCYTANYFHNRGYEIILPIDITSLFSNIFVKICELYPYKRDLVGFQQKLHYIRRNFGIQLDRFREGWKDGGIKKLYTFNHIDWDYFKKHVDDYVKISRDNYVVRNGENIFNAFSKQVYEELSASAKERNIEIIETTWQDLIENKK